MPEAKISEIEANKIGTSCIICNNFIEVKYSYMSGRLSDEYVCEDCKKVILALKQVGVQRILTVLNKIEVEENDT